MARYELCVPLGKGALATDGEVVARELATAQVASVTLIGDACLYPASLAGLRRCV